MRMKQKKKNFGRKKIQNGHFTKSPILKKISQKFYRLVLGLIGLIDAKKPINVAQPIWSWGWVS
jgi:hypothetical protein